MNNRELRHRREMLSSYRRLAAAAVFRVLSLRWDKRVRVALVQDEVTARICLPRWQWVFLGALHALRWLQCRKLAKAELKLVRVPVRLRVRVGSRPRKNKSTQQPGGLFGTLP